jgi:hypothetical protein
MIRMKKIKKIFLMIGILAILNLALVLADGNSLSLPFYFEKNSNIKLQVPCQDDIGNPCNESVSCNLTLIYPNSSVYIYDAPMTRNGTSFYNYSVGSSAVTGRYNGFMNCASPTGGAVYPFFMVISNMPLYINSMNLGIYAVLIALSFLYIYVAFKLTAVHLTTKLILFGGGLMNSVAVLFVYYLDMLNANLVYVMLSFFLAHLILFIAVLYFFMQQIALQTIESEKQKEDKGLI